MITGAFRHFFEHFRGGRSSRGLRQVMSIVDVDRGDPMNIHLRHSDLGSCPSLLP